MAMIRVYNIAKSIINVGGRVCRSTYRKTVAVARLVNSEVKRRPALPADRRMYAYRRGFLSHAPLLFDDLDDCLSNWQRERTRYLNGKRTWVHEDKLLWYYVFLPRFAGVLPELYGYISEGYRTDLPFGDSTEDTLRDCIASHDKLVIKGVLSGSGNDVYIIDSNTDPAEIDRLENSSEEFLVTEFIEQAEYAARIYPKATNTLRLITMIDPVSRTPFIAAAMHRFGTDASAPLDNFDQGGIIAGIDVHTGGLSEAHSYPTDGATGGLSTHPDTDEPIQNVEIPGWASVRDHVLEMADYVSPITPYVGWDIVVQDDGNTMAVIEANSHPGVNGIQTVQPLLSDDRNCNFYRYHGIID